MVAGNEGVRSMFRLGKFKLVAASLLCLLLLGTNTGASQNRDESIAEAAELNNEAVVCVEDHHYDQAVELLKKAIALRADLSTGHYNLGRIYQLSNDFDLAIVEFEHAVDANPNFVEAF